MDREQVRLAGPDLLGRPAGLDGGRLESFAPTRLSSGLQYYGPYESPAADPAAPPAPSPTYYSVLVFVSSQRAPLADLLGALPERVEGEGLEERASVLDAAASEAAEARGVGYVLRQCVYERRAP